MKSWKTTVAGAVGALGFYLEAVPEPSWLPVVGKFLVAISVAFLGLNARDNNVTSESAGAQ